MAQVRSLGQWLNMPGVSGRFAARRLQPFRRNENEGVQTEEGNAVKPGRSDAQTSTRAGRKVTRAIRFALSPAQFTPHVLDHLL